MHILNILFKFEIEYNQWKKKNNNFSEIICFQRASKKKKKQLNSETDLFCTQKLLWKLFQNKNYLYKKR